MFPTIRVRENIFNNYFLHYVLSPFSKRNDHERRCTSLFARCIELACLPIIPPTPLRHPRRALALFSCLLRTVYVALKPYIAHGPRWSSDIPHTYRGSQHRPELCTSTTGPARYVLSELTSSVANRALLNSNKSSNCNLRNTISIKGCFLRFSLINFPHRFSF